MTRQMLGIALACSAAVFSVTAHAEDSPTNAKQQVLAAIREWVAAENKHDAAALARLLDDQFISTYATRKPIGKDAFIKGIMSGKLDPTQSQSLTDETVTIDGDTAITTGIDTFHSAGKTGPAFRYTITYVRRDGRWQALAEHIVSAAGDK